jgi:hypothetical protein
VVRREHCPLLLWDGGEEGENGVKNFMGRKCQIVHLYNTNESPLWNLRPRLLTDEEEFLPDEYFAYLGHMVGAEVVIIMGQADADSGVLALDIEGAVVEIPKFSVEKLREHVPDADPEKLAKMDPEKLAQLVLEETNMKIFVVLPKDLNRRCWNYVSKEEVKCSHCNWRVTKLFVIAENKKEAIKLVKEGQAGLCGECFAEMLANEGYELKIPEKR